MNKINLINKKSGIITEEIESISYTPEGNIILVYISSGLRELRSYNSLAELNEEWEDAPEETPRATMPWGEDVRAIALPNGLEVAMEDYYEIDENGNKKTEFTWDEAMEIEKKTGGKWRVPTQMEWLQICTELGGKDGELDRDTLVTALNLTEDEDGDGYYWSSTASNAAFAYDLSFGSSLVLPGTGYNYKYNGFAVRLLKEDNHA